MTTGEQGSLFVITEKAVHSWGADPELHTVTRQVEMEVVPGGVFPEAVTADEPPVDQLAPDPYVERNEILLGIVKTGGYLAELGKRKGAVELKNDPSRSGWLPPALRKHQAEKGPYVEDNYAELEAGFERRITQACGLCALNSECQFAGKPLVFKDHFANSGTRQKLVRALTKEPETKCDTITRSKR